MKTIIQLLVLFLGIIGVVNSYGQDKSLIKAISTNDTTLARKTITKKPYTVNLGLEYAIDKENVSMVKFFIANKADLDRGFKYSIIKNKLNFCQLLLEKGANPNLRISNEEFYFDSIYVYDNKIPKLVNYRKNSKGEYWVDVNDTITFKDTLIFNGKIAVKSWALNSYLFRQNKLIKYDPKSGWYTPMYYAIINDNPNLVDMLLKYGYDLSKPYVVRGLVSNIPLSFQSDNFIFRMVEGGNSQFKANYYVTKFGDHFLYTTIPPSPALILTPLQHAFMINANKDIIEPLLKSDTSLNIKAIKARVTWNTDDRNISYITVTPFSIGFTLKYSITNKNVFSLSILSNVEGNDFKLLKTIRISADTKKNTTSNDSLTIYYYNEFGENFNPKELKLKFSTAVYETFVDERDGKEYKTVKIGDQVLMAENFRYKLQDGCWAYNNNDLNVDKFGYLYNYETAKKNAPIGWHLPSKDEWVKLYQYLGNADEEVYNAIQDSGTSGFNIVLSGWRDSKDKTYNVGGQSAFFWSSTVYDTGNNWSFHSFSQDKTANMGKNNPNDGLSIRYFKD